MVMSYKFDFCKFVIKILNYNDRIKDKYGKDKNKILKTL